MENLCDKILSVKKYKLMPEQMLLENNISVDGQDEIAKVLAVNSAVDIDRPIEALANECNISGKVVTNIIYSTVNGELNNQTSVSPFNYKISNENICVGAKLNAVATVVGTEVDKLINNNFKLITNVNFDVVVVKNDEVEYLKEGGNNTYIKQEEREVIALKGSYCEKFEEKLDIVVKNGVKKVLLTNVDCLLKEWVAGPNFISVECELYAKVLYADNQEISELQTITISKSVKQEIEVGGINKDTDLDVNIFVNKENILTEILEGEGETTISVTAPILVCFNTYEKSEILTVTDIYSEKEIISVQNDEMENCKNIKPEYLEGKIEGNVVLSDEQPRIDKYLATTNVSTSISNSYVNNGVLNLEGLVTANVIYLNDELGSIQSLEIEMPFVINKKVGDISDQAIIEPMLSIFDVDVMVKRGREIYFDAKVKAFVNFSCWEKFSIIANASSIGELGEKDGAIEIYFGRAGESLWDIAKSLKISSEIIRQQNPDISDPLDKDQNIALYFQK